MKTHVCYVDRMERMDQVDDELTDDDLPGLIPNEYSDTVFPCSNALTSGIHGIAHAAARHGIYLEETSEGIIIPAEHLQGRFITAEDGADQLSQRYITIPVEQPAEQQDVSVYWPEMQQMTEEVLKEMFKLFRERRAKFTNQ